MKNSLKKMEVTIGMETHVELRTNSKMFCGCPADHFSKKPNTQTCPTCLGLPGALPVPNRKAIEWAIMIGLALNCKIAKVSKFDRKHYFYPDLPKGYQISQYDEPLCLEGYLETTYGKVRITRVHLEEDTGKLQHTYLDGKRVTLVDFNRSGVPLVEIVTEPDIHSAAQAKEFTQKLQQIVRYLGVSDCDMEKGSMRLEANTSWGLGLGYKVEIKNLNSFRFVEKAIDYDLKRQKEILEAGETPRQETRGWDEKTNRTVTQRYKETAADYRYFPEPDIPPMEFARVFIEQIRKGLPELPDSLTKRFVNVYGVRREYADILVSERDLAKFTEKALLIAKKQGVNSDKLAGFIVNQKIDYKKIAPEKIVSLVSESQSAKISDLESLEEWLESAIRDLPAAVADYKKGKVKAVLPIIGRVMQLSKGRAEAAKVKELLEKKLSS